MDYRLDYQIHDYVDNHPSNDGYKYDHIHWEVQIHNKELLEEINHKFNSNLKIDEINIVTKELANMIKEYCWAVKKYMGTYGDKYKNDIVKQLFDKN